VSPLYADLHQAQSQGTGLLMTSSRDHLLKLESRLRSPLRGTLWIFTTEGTKTNNNNNNK